MIGFRLSFGPGLSISVKVPEMIMLKMMNIFTCINDDDVKYNMRVFPFN